LSSAGDEFGEPAHKDQFAFCKLLLLHSYGGVDDDTNLQEKTQWQAPYFMVRNKDCRCSPVA